MSEKIPTSMRAPEESGKSSIFEKRIRVPIERVNQINAELVHNAEQQLEIIGPSLRDLAERIEREKPDGVIFMDKSARPFGTPFKKYLNETMGSDAPAIRFYNDAWMKQAYLDTDEKEFEKIVEEDFEEIKGKKLFFIDETYSRGRGAAAIAQAQRILGPDVYYFALTTDPTEPQPPLHLGDYGITEEQHAEVLKQVQDNPHFVLYPNAIHDLFSRGISRLYVEEYEDGSTYGIWGDETDPDASERITHIKDILQAPEGVNEEEYEKELRHSIFETVRTVKQKIYDTLREKE